MLPTAAPLGIFEHAMSRRDRKFDIGFCSMKNNSEVKIANE